MLGWRWVGLVVVAHASRVATAVAAAATLAPYPASKPATVIDPGRSRDGALLAATAAYSILKSLIQPLNQ